MHPEVVYGLPSVSLQVVVDVRPPTLTTRMMPIFGWMKVEVTMLT
jgi:hypothetical protein